MSKKLLNSPDDCVDEFISGLIAIHKNLIKLPGQKVVLRKDLHNLKGKVAVISGGGSGHEPGHAGYVGKGMLTGVICGAIFTSPPASAIYAAIKAVNLYEPQGVILIVTNYTGDRVNFGLAREWALNEGIKVETIVVGEDCALTSPDRSAGRRGLAGTILVHKIAGALAEKGESIERMIHILEEVTENMGTIGICLQPCVLPGSKNPSFALGDNEMGLGLGVHGEAGIKNVQMRTSSETVNLMLDHMMDKNSDSHIDLSKEDEIVLMINNLGGTTNLEIGIVTNDVVKALTRKEIQIVKIFAGSYVTSLEMAGFSITILKVNSKMYSSNVSILDLLEMSAETPCSLTSGRYGINEPEPDLKQFERIKNLSLIRKPVINSSDAALLKECIASSCSALITISEKLNEFDRGSGDGDCGSTHTRGAEKILQELHDLDFKYPANVFQSIGLLCCESMGGTSGGMYSVLLAGFARTLSNNESFTIKSFISSLQEGLNAVMTYGGAQPGDRTMLDVLKPVLDKMCCLEGHLTVSFLREIQLLATKAANETINMKAKAGRSSYVSQDLLLNPDPGAVAIAEIINASLKVLLNNLTVF